MPGTNRKLIKRSGSIYFTDNIEAILGNFMTTVEQNTVSKNKPVSYIATHTAHICKLVSGMLYAPYNAYKNNYLNSIISFLKFIAHKSIRFGNQRTE